MGSHQVPTQPAAATAAAPAIAAPIVAPAAPVIPLAQQFRPLILPQLSEKHAPPKFKGKYSEVKRFIRHYEKLCAQFQITIPQEICENVTLYCSSRIVRFIEILPSYITHDWVQLKSDFLTYFDADKDSKRYRVSDLRSFVKKKRRIEDMSDWRKYTRDFISIGGWLLAKAKLASTDQDIYFWKGIPKPLREKFDLRLIAANPNRDRSIPHTIAEVSVVAARFLQRDRFDRELLDSDSDRSEDSDS
ncbi:hypothetical protein DFH29DRAFT_801118, partial [Suillus ampliporus]